MGDELFEIVLADTAKGITKNELIANVAKLFKARAEKIEEILRRKPIVIKKVDDYQVALKYKAALEKAGAIINLKRADSPIVERETEKTAGSAMACPKCGLEQPMAQECIRCGIIISKYNDAEAIAVQQASTESVAGEVVAPEDVPCKPFLSEIFSSFVYPIKGGNHVTLLAGVAFFWIVGLIPIIGGIGGIIFLFMMKACMLKIIDASARGEHQLPDFPDLDELIGPFFLVLVTQVVSFFPVFLFLYYQPEAMILPLLMINPGALISASNAFQHLLADPFLWFLLAIGILYMPMSLLIVALYNNILRINPITVISSILRIPLDYVIACFLIALVYIISAILKFALFIHVPLIGGLFVYLMSLYAMIVQMRIIGLLYASNRSKLGWFE